MIEGREILPDDASRWLPPEGTRLQVPVVHDVDPKLTLGVAWVFRSDDGRLIADVALTDPEHETYDLTFSVTGQDVDGVIKIKRLNVHMAAPAREGR